MKLITLFNTVLFASTLSVADVLTEQTSLEKETLQISVTNCDAPKLNESILQKLFTAYTGMGKPSKALPRVKAVCEKKCIFSNQQETTTARRKLIELFKAHEYKQLNQMLDKYNGMKNLMGQSFIQACIESLTYRYGGYEIASEWNNGIHNSAYSECVTARYLIKQAWNARGSDYAGSVTNTGWHGFHQLKAEAKQCLLRAISKNPSLSPVIPMMLEIVGSSGSREDVYNWVNLGLKIEPSNVVTLRCAFHYLRPRWGGSEDQLNDLAKQIVEMDQNVCPSAFVYWKYLQSVQGSYTRKSLSRKQQREAVIDDFKLLESIYREKIIPVYPKSVGPWVSLLGMANQWKLWRDFDRLLIEGIKLFPDEHMLYVRNGERLLKTNYVDYETRFDNLQNAVRIFPEKGTALYELAKLTKHKPSLTSKELHAEYVNNAVKYLSGTNYYPKAVNLKIDYLITHGKFIEAEQSLKNLKAQSMNNNKITASLSKFYYQTTSKLADKDRAWAYFMISWALENNSIGDLTVDDALKISVNSKLKNAEEWYQYGQMKKDISSVNSFPKEGVIRAFKESLKVCDDALLRSKVENALRKLSASE